MRSGLKYEPEKGRNLEMQEATLASTKKTFRKMRHEVVSGCDIR